MATHGSLGEFNSSKEGWVSYTERLEQYFAANEVVSADKQRAILLTCCGPDTYQLIKSLLAPAKPTDKSFQELVQLVKDHHEPKPSVIVQRYHFNSRVRKQGETVAVYVAELRQLTQYCEFGTTLNDMLRDRLVCGIQDKRIQRRLLSEQNLTLDKAIDLAQTMETAEKDIEDLQGTQNQGSLVNHVGSTRRKSPTTTNSQYTQCYRCGGKHAAPTCSYKDVECYKCKKKGHLARACRSTFKARKPTPQHLRPNSSQSMHQLTQEDTVEDTTHLMFNLSGNRVKPLVASLTVEGAELRMEVDTGASLSLISEATYRKLWPKDKAPQMESTQIKLRTYTGEELEVLGTINVDVTFKEQLQNLRLVIVAGEGPSLMGRDWLRKIQLDWNELYFTQANNNNDSFSLQVLLNKYGSVFRDGLGTVQGMKAKIHVKEQAQPQFYRARTVPYAIREKVEADLDRLEQEGIIEPVQFSDWAAPIVPVLKKDGSVRICGDYKLTVNKAAKPDTYPLPRIEDLFASLAGGQTFSKLDLAHAYQQIELEEESKQLLTVNTHKGLYRYHRLPFGVSAAPSIFQRAMDNLLQGLPGVCVYLDDILVTGKSEAEHLRNLEEVLKKLDAAGIRLKKAKCVFMQTKVEYLGHIITKNGLQPSDEKVRAIQKAPSPQNTTQLRSFLGMITYYSKFLPNLSTQLAPIYSLLQKNTRWKWGPKQKKAFEEAKELLVSAKVLAHYDPYKDLYLACDASPYGIGAVLSHRMDNGDERPIAFASRSLSQAERKYAQLDKEGLAIIFGVKRFHQYLLGRKFIILSDHKPLQHLFSESKAIPHMASARIQRWALTLSAYDYSIMYKAGKDHANADVLSRLPLPETVGEVSMPPENVLLMENLQASPVGARQIKRWTDRDPTLSQVRRLVSHGWKNTTDPDLRPYQQRKDELSIHDGCILWGNRVVVPPPGRKSVLEELHLSHPGISRMKSLARSYVWWPNMDKELEAMVKTCIQCQLNRKSPPASPLHPWDWPERPWSRLHADYAGPFMGKMFLVVVDAYSKWLEVKTVDSATSQRTIQLLRSMFATHGLPELLVTDNGSVFTSAEFKEFMQRNGIRHVTSAPYHPASNGLVERAVQTLKEGLKKSALGTIETKVDRFLFQYRLTPHSTTGTSPAELLLGRRPRCLLDLLYPDISGKVRLCQERQKATHDQHAKGRVVVIGDDVFIRNFGQGPTWLAGSIMDALGTCSYQVKLTDGRIVRRHMDHIRPRTTDIPPESPEDDFEDDFTLPEIPDQPVSNPPSEQTPDTAAVAPTTEPELRRSSRNRYPPSRFGWSYTH